MEWSMRSPRCAGKEAPGKDARPAPVGGRRPCGLGLVAHFRPRRAEPRRRRRWRRCTWGLPCATAARRPRAPRPRQAGHPSSSVAV
eukprot:scaffold7053_cov134-Isochrysis_galbana.AAC.2